MRGELLCWEVGELGCEGERMREVGVAVEALVVREGRDGLGVDKGLGYVDREPQGWEQDHSSDWAHLDS